MSGVELGVRKLFIIGPHVRTFRQERERVEIKVSPEICRDREGRRECS